MMLDVKRFFPNNVWEQNWKTGLWSSRPITKDDKARREQYLADFADRQEERDELRRRKA